MVVLITGGAGYIGSHICVELIQNGHQTVIYDNFSNSRPEVLQRMRALTGIAPSLVRGDVRDQSTLADVLRTFQCDAVVHCAGMKSVFESIRFPDMYYDNNVIGTQTLIQAMQQVGVLKLIFSSSATIYGEPISLPLKEEHPRSPLHPYGRTKLLAEELLESVNTSSKSMKVAILRYFNPVGSHESGLIGEDPQCEPNNLMPYIAQVAVGRRPYLTVFGKDYDTPDGTGVRDYVHVMDIASGHLKALERLQGFDFIKVNLGTGRGVSVLELVDAFARASGRDIPVVVAPRRDGDISSCYASCERADAILQWRPTRNLHDMCRDSWNWQSKNPRGYESSVY